MSSNALVAGGAADVATLLTQHPTLPPVAAIEVIASGHTEDTRVSVQLRASTTELDHLVTWSDVLDDVTATVQRRQHPHAFVSVEVHGVTAGTAVTCWTHPEGVELTALWAATEHVPELNIRATVSLDALRTAAENAAEREPVVGDVA